MRAAFHKCSDLAGFMGRLGAATAIASLAAAPASAQNDWPSYNRPLTSERFSPLRAINASTVSGLEVLCAYDTGQVTSFQSGLVQVDGALFATTELKPDAIDAQARAEYLRAFAVAGGAHAGFEYYRALFTPGSLRRAAERRARPLPMPVLAIGAEGGVGRELADGMKGTTPDLRSVFIPGCGHYVPEECPGEFTTAVTAFWADTAAARR